MVISTDSAISTASTVVVTVVVATAAVFEVTKTVVAVETTVEKGGYLL